MEWKTSHVKHQEAVDSTDKVVQDLPESPLDHASLPLSSLSETIMNSSKEHQNQELTSKSMVHRKGAYCSRFFT